jgi:putative ABC transport system permease protein
MTDIVRELRYALRTLRRSPAFTVTSIVVLALAIGANTAMFGVLNAVVLRPLPFPAPEQLVMLWREVPSQQVREGRAAYRDVEDWRQQNRSFTSLAVFDPASATLTSAGESERIGVLRISPDAFLLLGVQPIAGRVFTSRDADERQPVALVSERFWRARFGGSRDAIGASIDLDGRQTQIIGVLPPSVEVAPFDADVWEPHTRFVDWDTRRLARGAGSWFVLGRLRAGVTSERAQDEMTSIVRRLDAQTSSGVAADNDISIVPLSTYVTGARPRLVLWTLTGAVLCVLLMAATNVASLSLARAAVRERDIAIRAALGASRSRVVRQLLVESLTLVSIAGALGVAVAAAVLRAIVSAAPITLARLSEVGLDARVLGWTSGLCLATGVAVGLAPAVLMARRATTLVTRESGRGLSSGIATRRARRALVVAQFALAIVLLTGAGLLLRSLWSAERVDLGFTPQGLLSLQIATPAGETSAWRADVYDRALEQIAALPGVERAAMIGDLFVGGAAEQSVTIDGSTSRAPQRMTLRRDEVSERFFETAGVPLRRGRTFSAADGPGAPRVAIVNEAMATRLWPGADPIGRRFALGTAATSDANLRQPPASLAATVGEPWFTVIGVVGDMRRQELEREPVPQMFEPLAQNPSRLETVLIRTSSLDPLTLSKAVQGAIRRADARVTTYGVTTVEQRLGSMLAARRFETSLLVAFAIVALTLAAIGLYGLVQYSVTTRTAEISIRMAIGANAHEIFRMVLREGLALSAAGTAIGLCGALWLARAGASLLFGVSARDPVTFVSVSLVLTVIAAVACGVPARRAMKIDPNAALRQG